MAHAGPQVIIMTTPIAHFFRCAHQDGFMWLFAVGVGAGSLLVSFLTKVLTRYACLPCTLGLKRLLQRTYRVCVPASGKVRCKQQRSSIESPSEVVSADVMLPLLFRTLLPLQERCHL